MNCVQLELMNASCTAVNENNRSANLECVTSVEASSVQFDLEPSRFGMSIYLQLRAVTQPR